MKTPGRRVVTQWTSFAVCLAMASRLCVGAESSTPTPTPALPDAVRQQADAAAARGLDWLAAKQRKNGSWSNESYPALTAFGLWAFARSQHPARTDICARAAAFVAGFAQPDGGIYKPPSLLRRGGLSTYNTAVCMTALYVYDPQKYAPIVLAARRFMAENQISGDSGNAGGFGYDRPSKGGWAGRPDLSNTAWALQAMRLTQGVQDQVPTGERADVNWDAALQYIGKLQNQDAGDAENYGGFGYERGASRGGTATNKDGVVTLRGYGSMTYAGLLSMIYAQVDRKDPRVVSTLQWAGRHWSVDENPGMGSKGLFYYYTIMSKALSLIGGDTFPDASGTPVPWKAQLLSRLVALQHPDGSWSNDDNQFWEGDPVLATTDALLTLQYVLGQ